MARIASRNSWRRLRFASVSRSMAWSDFFLAVAQDARPTVEPETSSSQHRCRIRFGLVTRLPLDRHAPRSVPPSVRSPLDSPGSSGRAGDGPAPLARAASAGGRSSPRNRDSHRTQQPVCENYHDPSDAPRISSVAGRPHRLVPSRLRRGVLPLPHYTIFAIALVCCSR